MTKEVVATFRNSAAGIEIDIERDACHNASPLSTETWWLEFIVVIDYPGYPREHFGTASQRSERINAAVDHARYNGGLAVPVQLKQGQAVELRTEDEKIEGWTEHRIGFVVVTRTGLHKAGLTQSEARERIATLVKQQEHWCNGKGYALAEYLTTRCSPDTWHRTSEAVKRTRGYLGDLYTESNALDDAGIRSGTPPAIAAGWEQVCGIRADQRSKDEQR